VTPIELLRWDAPGPYEVAFSTRLGGVSDGAFASLNLGLLTADEPERVRRNRRSLCAAAGLILLFVALTRGEASTVVPATAAYPVVTLAGSALFLSESVTVARVAGTVLVIAGVVLLSR